MAKYSVHQQPVETLLSWIKSGDIAIPEIQRPFVWKAAKVRDLIDSLYQNTNYFKEVISECTDFKNKNPKHNKKPVIEAKEEIKIENDENIYKLLIIILILIIIIGVFYVKKAS